ncbi:MAG: CCA tRNA nucleotidyltransferase [Thermoplasmata archaeon]
MISNSNWEIFKADLLKDIFPDQKDLELKKDIALEIINKIRELSVEYPYRIDPIHVGSTERGTYIKNSNADIDIFMLFPTSVSMETLRDTSFSIASKVIKGEKRYASHPYMHGVYKNHEIEIVPAYLVENPENTKMSAVDRTPFHAKYVKDHVTEDMKKDIVLLKYFLKNRGIYGAEAKINGISGYLTELLIIYYKTFENLMENVASWKPQVKLTLTVDNFKNFDNPLVFIDPVDSNRNVAAALSINTFAKFVHLSKKFQYGYYEELFSKNIDAQKRDWVKSIKERGTSVIAIKVPSLPLVDDVLYPQMQRFLKVVMESLEDNAFRVVNGIYYKNDSSIYFLIELYNSSIPELLDWEGPYVWGQNSKDFLDKWESNREKFSKPFIKDGKWHVYIKRKYKDAVSYLKGVLPTKSVGKDLSNQIAKGFSVYEINESTFTEEIEEPLTNLLYPSI